MSERQIGIPPDWEQHPEIVFPQSEAPPFMWHRQAGILRVAKMLESSNGFLKIGIIDTGYTPHKWLPEPQEVKNFTSDRTSNANNPHGEHVFGIVGGLMGIGLLPKARFYIAKGLSDSGSGSTTWLNGAIRWMADMGVHFVNGSGGLQSVGGTFWSPNVTMAPSDKYNMTVKLWLQSDEPIPAYEIITKDQVFELDE